MSKEKILMVEDDPDHAKLAEKILEHAGYEVVWKSSAKEGIKAYKSNDFVVCLLDIMLPDMSGSMLVGELRKIKTPAPPMLAVTAHAVDGVKKDLIDKGFDGYITKPYVMQEFVKTVQEYIKG